jgi:hypothetical protein
LPVCLSISIYIFNWIMPYPTQLQSLMILAGGPISQILGDGIADSIREIIQSLILEGTFAFVIANFYTMMLNTKGTKHNATKLNYTSIELSLMSLSNVMLSIMTLSIMTLSIMILIILTLSLMTPSLITLSL